MPPKFWLRKFEVGPMNLSFLRRTRDTRPPGSCWISIFERLPGWCQHMYNQALKCWCRARSFFDWIWETENSETTVKAHVFFRHCNYRLSDGCWVWQQKAFLQCGHGLREPSAFPRSWMASLSSSSIFLSLGLTALFSIALTTVITGTEWPLAQDSGKEPKNFLTNHSPGRNSCLSHNRTLKRKRRAEEEMVNCIQTIQDVTDWTVSPQIHEALMPSGIVFEDTPLGR